MPRDKKLRKDSQIFDAVRFEEFLGRLMEEYQAPGVAVGVLCDDRIVFLKGFGYRNQEKRLPVTENTVFGIASVTKSFTALAVQQLAEKNKIFTASPVRRYLPEFDLPQPFWAEKVTVHNFLTHTSGIPPLPSLGYAIAESGRKKRTKEKAGDAVENLSETRGEDHRKRSYPRIATYADLMEYLSSQDYEALGLPGQYLSYSNDCYGLLGAMIERASGLSYEDYLQENVLLPLGLTHTTARVEEMNSFSEVTKLYYKDKEDKLKCALDWQEAPAFTACGFLKSTALDLLEYLKMYLRNGRRGRRKIVSAQSVQSMITPYYPSNRGMWYGYGFNIRPGYGKSKHEGAPQLQPGQRGQIGTRVSCGPDGVTLVQHSGSLRGVASNIGFVPEKNIAAVVLSNLTGFPASKVWLGAINLLLGLPVDHPIVQARTYEQPESILKKIEGEYRSGEGGLFRFHVDGQKLFMEVESRTYPVRMTGPDSGVATIKAQENHMGFLYDHKGDVWALKYGLRIIRKRK